MSDPLDLPVESLGPRMSARLLTCLTSPTRGNGIQTIRELTTWTERRIRGTPGMGATTFAELKRLMLAKGLEFAEPDKDGHPPIQFPSLHERLATLEARLAALERLVTTGRTEFVEVERDSFLRGGTESGTAAG